MLGRHILARNFFLRPDYAHYVPEAVRPYHARRFREAYETVKRLDYDEWHRTLGSPQVRAQAEFDAREGRKHNIQLGFASQRLSDMGDALISQSTGRSVLKAGDEREAEEVIKRFNLTPASAAVVRHGLHGPGPNGAPFLAIMQIDNSNMNNSSSTVSARSSSGRSRPRRRTRLCAIASTRPSGFKRRCGALQRCFLPARRKRRSSGVRKSGCVAARWRLGRRKTYLRR